MHKAMWCGTLVAAKILKSSSSIALGDFRSEIEVLRRVHHPNAVQARSPTLSPTLRFPLNPDPNADPDTETSCDPQPRP